MLGREGSPSLNSTWSVCLLAWNDFWHRSPLMWRSERKIRKSSNGEALFLHYFFTCNWVWQEVANKAESQFWDQFRTSWNCKPWQIYHLLSQMPPIIGAPTNFLLMLHCALQTHRASKGVRYYLHQGIGVATDRINVFPLTDLERRFKMLDFVQERRRNIWELFHITFCLISCRLCQA